MTINGTAQHDQPLIEVCVVLFDDGYASEALIPCEVFHSAGTLWQMLRGGEPQPRFNVTTASIDGKATTPPYGGVRVTPQHAIADIKHADIIVVPASGSGVNPKNFAILPWLKHHYERGAYLVGVCAGAAYLAEAGLLKGRRGTAHWAMCETITEQYPDVDWRLDLMVTEDSRLLCGGGVTASSDVSLYLVEKLCGREVAVETAKILVLSMPRTHQSGYAVLPLSPPHDDDRIRDVEAFIQQRFRDVLPTETLASQAGMSERNFLRRFKAATGRVPAAYQQAVRIEAAKAMLEREMTSVQRISEQVGYDDASFFRTLFKRNTGMTPAEYRTHFAGVSGRVADGSALGE